MNRRTFLGSMAALSGVAFAGCTGKTQETTLRRTDESAVEISTIKEHSSESVYDCTGHLEKEEFADMKFWSKIEFTFEWKLSVTNGAPIDVWVIPQKEFKSFRNQEDPSFFDSVSKMNVNSETVSGTIRPGNHMIIWENSDAYATTPKGAVDFNVIIHLIY